MEKEEIFQQGLHGPMDKALVYETRDSGFDPQWSRYSFGFLEWIGEWTIASIFWDE